ncbi:hypothetical protein AB0M46_49100 [Dactylosporangium sp. NPDC051485]|uniref:hypothetical protein n=1 Tax=Dactylosporangium sp. NPDC051485 TaxID=3154846 RepID=UPI003427991E
MAPRPENRRDRPRRKRHNRHRQAERERRNRRIAAQRIAVRIVNIVIGLTEILAAQSIDGPARNTVLAIMITARTVLFILTEPALKLRQKN